MLLMPVVLFLLISVSKWLCTHQPFEQHTLSWEEIYKKKHKFNTKMHITKKPSDYHIFKSGIDLVEEVNLPASRLQWLNHE